MVKITMVPLKKIIYKNLQFDALEAQTGQNGFDSAVYICFFVFLVGL